MLVNILTPGFTTSNGSAFLFPLIVFKNEIRNAGIDISIVKQSDKNISQCDVVAIDSKQFRHIPDDQQDEIKELITYYRSSKAKIIWFDTTDSTGTLQSEMVPVVDKYMKAQLLRNKTRYEQRIYGGRELSEYYFQTAGIVDSDEKAVNNPISKNDTAKLGISWNSGLANYSTYGPLKMGLYRRTHVPYLLSYPYSPTQNPRERTNDLSARFGISYSRQTVRYQREKIRDLLSTHLDTRKLNRRDYMKELRQSKAILSPFGWGEITLKDFEVFLTGGMLLKPSMEHMETWPDFYVDGVTYTSFDWDLSDLEKKIEWALHNDTARESIALEGHHKYLRHTSGINAAELFATHLTSVLSTEIPTTE
ncbi:MAG: glycosyltransferase [Chloroflexota bacterium]|nr:glycosyltransferase [Chloroflexota bacterium]